MSTTAPARVGDETMLFAELHPTLARQVRRLVRTSEENVQDACSFAFLQLLRYQPSRQSVFPWLRTVAVREAVKLDRRGRRDRRLPAREDGVELEPFDERADPERWLEALAALEAIAAAGLTARRLGSWHYMRPGTRTSRSARCWG
jgi:DNA-directed RNA polymerase specialized sigma24 family protein